MVCKMAYFSNLHKIEWQVKQETIVFVFYVKSLIFGHPWHPWTCQYNFCYCSGKDAGGIPHSESVAFGNKSPRLEPLKMIKPNSV